MAARTPALSRKLSDAAPAFAALGDQTRLQLVWRLCANGPQSIVRLSEGARVSRQAITKHLHALSRAGLVRSRKAGRERIWEMQPKRLAEVGRHLDQISARWDQALERLREFVEAGG